MLGWEEPVGSVASSKGTGVADLIRNSDQDPDEDPDRDEDQEDRPEDRIETDLSAETPTDRWGPPWRKEPAPEIIIRGMPAEMLTAVLCTAATFVILRFGFELNRYVALVAAFASTIPWIYRGWIYRGGGKIGVTLKMRWRNGGHRRREEDLS
jgi:hypothetical protein